MKKISQKRFIIWWICILSLLFLLTPFLRNYIIHNFYSAMGLLSRDLQYQFRNDLECEVVATPISEEERIFLYPDEYEDIIGFDYEIKVKNISSGYIQIDGSPEVSLHKSFLPYIHFLELPHEKVREYREIKWISTDQTNSNTPIQPITFLWDRMKWGDQRIFTRKYFFYTHEKMEDMAPYIVRFYIDYIKNNTWPRGKFCSVKNT